MPNRPDRGWVIAVVLVSAYVLASVFAVSNAIDGNLDGYAMIMVEGYDSLGYNDSALDVPVNNLLARDAHWLMPSLTIMYLVFVFLPGLGALASIWMTYGLGILFTAVGALLIFAHGRKVLSGMLAPLGLMALFLALPATFGVTVYWQQNPNLVLLYGSLFLLARGNFAGFLALSLIQVGFHPIAIPVVAAIAWAALVAPLGGRPPLLPGLEKRDFVTRRRWMTTIWVLGAVFVIELLAMVAFLLAGDHQSLSWYFLWRKVDVTGLQQLRNLPINLLFFAPLLFLPLANRLTWPAILPLVLYTFVGPQSLATALSSLVIGVAFLSFLHKVASASAITKNLLIYWGLTVAVVIQLFLPWRMLFPMWRDTWPGGLLSAAAYTAPPNQQRLNAVIEKKIPVNTGTCLTNFELVPRILTRCDVVTPLTYPARKESWDINDFVERFDDGRIERGYFDVIFLDYQRLAADDTIDGLMTALDLNPSYRSTYRDERTAVFQSVVNKGASE